LSRVKSNRFPKTMIRFEGKVSPAGSWSESSKGCLDRMEKKESDKSSIVLAAEPRLIDANGAALLCGVSVRFWHQLDSAGRVPKPMRLGRRCLWSLEEIDSWVRAGCPTRERWVQQKKS